MFKVVSTLERKGIMFTAVPASWEQNGILLWPDKLTTTKREKLRSNAESEPDTDWSKYKCILKCSNLPTFKEALTMEKQLTECVDTDSEEMLFVNKKTEKKLTMSAAMIDRNYLFDDTENQQISTVTPSEILAPSEAPPQMKSQEELVLLEPTSTTTLTKENFITIKNEMQILIEEKLEAVRNEYKKINISLDKIIQLLLEKKTVSSNDIPTLSKDVVLIEFDFPIRTHETLLDFDKEVGNNKKYRKQLVEFLTKFCGSSGDGDGLKIGYKIVDYIFAPELLIEYTWTGVSRKEGEKKPFQLFENIINIFQEVITYGDSRFTRQKTINLFKDGVLKHAKKRSQRKRTKTGDKGESPTGMVDAQNQETVQENLNRPETPHSQAENVNDVQFVFDIIQIHEQNSTVPREEEGETKE